uniref:NADH dehydrogenase subunit 4L n=1 Tax=Parascombrops philippinensis TaxID=2937804 RepID=UPI001FF2F525|nr:NADH dehydrogenase subunit 4L [Synagrops philippinensis]UOK10017.1 NADH dehydrogenase subunit 4L [Synagrops philippinensis]UVN21649.1 NADH dehydrogenase subunit 4L [Synagrops philippinensis]
MNPVHFVFSTTFSLSLTGLMLNRLHFLSTLLCLEGMMLSLFLAFSLWALHMDFCNLAMIPMLLLAFSACEASTGLALLVATARTHGSDLLRNFNLLKC